MIGHHPWTGWELSHFREIVLSTCQRVLLLWIPELKKELYFKKKKPKFPLIHWPHISFTVKSWSKTPSRKHRFHESKLTVIKLTSLSWKKEKSSFHFKFQISSKLFSNSSKVFSLLSFHHAVSMPSLLLWTPKPPEPSLSSSSLHSVSSNCAWCSTNLGTFRISSVSGSEASVSRKSSLASRAPSISKIVSN